MNPDELAVLEEERRFLLRSIDDIDREYAAGDVDEADYRTVRDGYVARAAAVLRQIEQGTASLPTKRPVRWSRVVLGVVATLVFAAVAGWSMARFSGQRDPGETMTGGFELDEVTAKLARARAMLAADPGGAIELYQEVIAEEPNNPEARTYTAWLLAISAGGVGAEASTLALDEATKLFEEVIADTPGYADAHCLYAVTAARWFTEPDLDLARTQGEVCLASNPPGEMRTLIENFVGNLG
jgi:hypothetical protein